MTSISIVTTSFNAARTIRETIESVINQCGSFEAEHIITDAGSSDGTLEIVASYGSKVRLISAVGLNQAAGINLGLKEAKGEILAFLNADDVYEEDALEKVSKAFIGNPNKKWLIGRCKIIDLNGKEMHSWITSYKNLLLKFYSYPLLLTENFICQPAVFFRSQVLSEYGYFAEDQQYVMDYEYWLRLGRTGLPIVLDDNLASFRRFTGTKSNSGFVQQFKDDKCIAKRYAIETGNYWTIPVKYVNYLKTIGIYKALYR